jgi:hypothetical protein
MLVVVILDRTNILCIVRISERLEAETDDTTSVVSEPPLKQLHPVYYYLGCGIV